MKKKVTPKKTIVYPFCVKYVQKRGTDESVKMKLVECDYYHTSERVIGKYYKPISLLSL